MKFTQVSSFSEDVASHTVLMNHWMAFHQYELAYACLRVSVSENIHCVHSYDFSPVCVLLFLARLLAWLNSSPHCMHSYGFSPVCVLMCLARLPDSLNPCPHWVHSYGCSHVCVLMCGKVTQLTKLFSTLCAFIWLLACMCPHVWQGLLPGLNPLPHCVFISLLHISSCAWQGNQTQ